MKTKEVFHLVLIGLAAALIGWLVSSFFVKDPGDFELHPVKELVQEIPKKFETLPPEFFNADQSLDTYDEVCIGEGGREVICPDIEDQ